MVPSYSQLSFDVTVKAITGFGIATVTKTNQKLWALLLATQSIGHYALARLSQALLGKRVSESTVYETTRAISYLVAIIAIKQAGLISLRIAGLFAFFNLAFLLGRIKWLNAQLVS